jgi:hypothetical protein
MIPGMACTPPGRPGEPFVVSAEGGSLRVYRTDQPPVLDGELDEEEWARGYAGSVSWRINKIQRTRHYTVKGLYDRDALYLFVRSYTEPEFRTRRVPAPMVDTTDPALDAIDMFPIQLRSGERRVVATSIGSDGYAYAWEFANIPSLEEMRSYPVAEYGIEVAARIDHDPRRSRDKMLWDAEIQIPLEIIRPLGRPITLKISGRSFLLNFYPPN